jgi:hypothetical protein
LVLSEVGAFTPRKGVQLGQINPVGHRRIGKQCRQVLAGVVTAEHVQIVGAGFDAKGRGAIVIN